MPEQQVAMIKVVFAVLFAGSLMVALPATPCTGSDRASADPTITLDVQNEPLRSVLGRISKTTRWTINAPDKWMDKPITQTLNQVSLEKGVRFILKDAGVENLLLTYDEARRTITVHDTDVQPAHSAARPPAQGEVRPPVIAPGRQSDPMLTRGAKDAESAPSGKSTRRQSRRQAAHLDEE